MQRFNIGRTKATQSALNKRVGGTGVDINNGRIGEDPLTSQVDGGMRNWWKCTGQNEGA